VAEFFAKFAKEQGVPTEELEKRFVTTNRPTSLLKRIATVEGLSEVGYVEGQNVTIEGVPPLFADGGTISIPITGWRRRSNQRHKPDRRPW
jgi:hypothetical protein